MADNDDFEIIDDTGLSNEQIFEFIDVNDTTDNSTKNIKSITPETVLPLLIPKPLVNEVPQVVQQQQSTPLLPPSPPPPSVIIPSEPKLSIKITTSTPPVIQTKKTISTSPPRIIPSVPSLSKAPAPQRYGNAAQIPHTLNETSVIDAAINQSKTIQQTILHMHSQQQQDVQTVLEQRRNLFMTK
ncbi:hypothetical protein I4U23_009667 [Adineta vaga]|nr:hypothetical protein I4U23_009667 [Adineta vaga]